MLYNNNIFIILIYIFIVFTVIYTIIVKPQFLYKDVEQSTIEKFQNSTDDDDKEIEYNKNNMDVKQEMYFRNTLTDYKKNFNFNNPYVSEKDYHMKLTNRIDINQKKPLLTYMCVKHNVTTPDNVYEIHNMINELYDHFYLTSADLYANNTNDIINKISDLMDSVSRNSGEFKLKGPIYVAIYQSPYLRYDNREITAKFDMNNMKPSYEQYDKDVSIGTHPLFVKIVVMFPNYIDILKLGKIYRQPNNKGLEKFKSYFNQSIRSKLCFMECPKNNTLGCGCLNRNENDGDPNFYESTCLNIDKKRANYGMLYLINRYYLPFANKFDDIDS